MAHATTRVRHCYLVRHAIAEERGRAWPDDTARPLTSDGARRMRRGVRGLSELGVTLDVIVTSPLLRARQTADILARGLDVRADKIELAELAPDTPPEVTIRAVSALTDALTFALVGHEPDLGRLAAWLIGARQPIAFKKGGVCRIDIPVWPASPRCRLIWSATPKMLRRLGGDRRGGGG